MAYEDIIELASAKERFMGNYALFSRFLFQFPDRSLFGDLEKQIEAGDVKTAFETAHTMKGITANLSLKKIEEVLVPMVETLRDKPQQPGKLPEAKDWEALKDAYAQTVDAIRKIQKEGVPLF